MKRQLTPEQETERAERKAKLAELIKQISGMTAFQRMQLFAKLPLVVNCEGRALSVRNTILIHHQIANPSMVGGFRQWLKVGRCVRKGEHGASILFPRTPSKAQESAQADNADGETQVKTGMRFLTGTVFDIDQTIQVEGTDVTLPLPVTDFSVADASIDPAPRPLLALCDSNAPTENVIDGQFQLV